MTDYPQRPGRSKRDRLMQWVERAAPTQVADALYGCRRDRRHLKKRVNRLTTNVKALAARKQALEERVAYLEAKIRAGSSGLRHAIGVENWRLVEVEARALDDVINP